MITLKIIELPPDESIQVLVMGDQMSGDTKENVPIVTTANEVILALVKPAGTDLSGIKRDLRESCSKVNAELIEIELTDLISDIDPNLTLNDVELSKRLEADEPKSEEYRKLSRKMHVGTFLRKKTRRDVFAAYGLGRILMERRQRDPGLKKVYLLDSLKHPDEVILLRQAYADSFFLLAVNASAETRRLFLKERRKMKEDEAVELIGRDEDEGSDHGQKMSDVFQKADFFLKEGTDVDETDRFIELVFGNTKIAPFRHEYYMHLAASAAAFSSDLSRQVGALIVSKTGEIIAIGSNDVPKAGGGQYASGDSPDARDVTIGHEPNHLRKVQINYKDLTEYQRSVHAEMEAVLSCARRGEGLRGATLYCTTYPCHNCARHLLGAGISEVYYIEPYPKSRALELHSDAIIHEGGVSKIDGMLVLRRFYGIGPRRFFDLFSQILSTGIHIERKEDKTTGKPWEAKTFLAAESC